MYSTDLLRYSLNSDIETDLRRRQIYTTTMEQCMSNLKLIERLKVRLKRNTTISAMALDENEEIMICGGANGVVRLFNIDREISQQTKKKKKFTSQYDDTKMITDIQWCGIDARLFLMSCTSDKLAMCETTKGAQIGSRTFESSPIQFHWNRYHATNPMVAVSDMSQHAKIIDFRVGLEINQDIRWSDIPVCAVQWYPSGRHLLYVGDVEGNLAQFDVRSARRAVTQRKIGNHQISSIRTSSDGHRLVILNSQNTIQILNDRNLKELASHKLPNPFRPTPGKYPRCMEVFDDVGIYVAVPIDRQIVVVNFGDVTTTQILRGNLNDVMSVIFRKSRNQLLSGASHSSILTWSAEQSSRFKFLQNGGEGGEDDWVEDP